MKFKKYCLILLTACLVLTLSLSIAAQDSEWVDTTSYKTEPPYKIGVSVGHSATDWMRMYVEEMKYWADKRPELVEDFILVDANNKIAKQISDIEDLISRGVDILIVDPISAKSTANVVKKAYNSGIPVIVNKNPINTEEYICYQNSSDVDFGRVGAEFLVKELNGKGKIIALRGVPGYGVDIQRWQGAEEVFDQYPDIKIVGKDYGYWAFDKAKAVSESLLAANPDIDGVWSAGGQMTRACIEAFLESGRELVPMVGEAQYEYLKTWKKFQDKGLTSIAPSKPTYLGAKALQSALNILHGIPVKKKVMYPAPVITGDQLDNYLEQDLPNKAWCITGLPTSLIKELFASR